jgi:hypothetical protein
LHRDLSSDWIHGGDELIELSMSEAQWASFVTAMNIGDGVQCTLEYVGDERIPALPEPASRADQFASEMKRTVEASSKALRELSKEVEGMGLPKGKTRQILGSIGHALMQLESNAPYVAKRFDEHVEEGVEAAKPRPSTTTSRYPSR